MPVQTRSMTRRIQSYNKLHEQWNLERSIIKDLATSLETEDYDHDPKKMRRRYVATVKKYKDTRSAFDTHPTCLTFIKWSTGATHLYNDIEDAQMDKPLISTSQFFLTFISNLRRLVETPAGCEIMMVAGNEGVAFREFINREIEREQKRFSSNIELIRLGAKFQGMCSVIEKMQQTA